MKNSHGLMQFVDDMQFDRVGVFTYSFEAQTPSGQLPDQVPADVAEARRDVLMAKQQQISLSKNQRFVGKTLTTLIEGNDPAAGAGQGISVGRTYRDAPEVDGLVIIEGTVPAGEMVPVKITGAMEYDLHRHRGAGTAVDRVVEKPRRTQSHPVLRGKYIIFLLRAVRPHAVTAPARAAPLL